MRSGLIDASLPSPAKAPPSGPDWLHEIKHDGFRILARRGARGVRLYTRNGHAPCFHVMPVTDRAEQVTYGLGGRGTCLGTASAMRVALGMPLSGRFRETSPP